MENRGCYHCSDLLSEHIESLVQPLGVLHAVKVGVGFSTHSSSLDSTSLFAEFQDTTKTRPQKDAGLLKLTQN